MKQVRLLLTSATLLWVMLAYAKNPGHVLRSSVTQNNQLNLSRARASLAIDTYGYFDIRVWVDGTLINRRPLTYVEIPYLRPGRRWVDIEVSGPGGIRMLSHSLYIEPFRWNLFQVAMHGNRGWVEINPVFTQPLGYHYVGGRRQSVRLSYRDHRPHGAVHIDITKKHHGYDSGDHHKDKDHDRHKSRGYRYGSQDRDHSEKREHGRSGRYRSDRDDDDHKPRNGNRRSGGH